VTAGGRSAGFPLFLSSATENVLASGVSAGLGPADDANLVGVYLPQDPTAILKLASSTESLTADNAGLKLVKQALAGVHLAAAAEAMSLAAKVGLDAKTMYEIISTAAGASKQFVEKAPMWLSGEWTSGKSIDDVLAELVSLLYFSGGRMTDNFRLRRLKGRMD
jgi:3-hydroxyisobutyrate dehydrogenase